MLFNDIGFNTILRKSQLSLDSEALANIPAGISEPGFSEFENCQPTADFGRHELPSANLGRSRVGRDSADRECSFPSVLRLQLPAAEPAPSPGMTGGYDLTDAVKDRAAPRRAADANCSAIAAGRGRRTTKNSCGPAGAGPARSALPSARLSSSLIAESLQNNCKAWRTTQMLEAWNRRVRRICGEDEGNA